MGWRNGPNFPTLFSNCGPGLWVIGEGELPKAFIAKPLSTGARVLISGDVYLMGCG